MVPKEAVLWTGEQAIVYEKKEEGFVMHSVYPRADLGAAYLVAGPWKGGEEIVTNGAFVIDASAQLRALPSMIIREAPR